MTLFAVAMAGLFPILHLGRPWFFYWLLPMPNTHMHWPQWRSPLVWDFAAIATYATVSLLFWYLGLIPDLAILRDRARRRGAQLVYGILALGWRGSARHWRAIRQRLLPDGGAGDAAGGFGSFHRGAGFCLRSGARLSLDDLPALFRRRRALFRLRDGADHRDPAAAAVSRRGPDHRSPHRQRRADHDRRRDGGRLWLSSRVLLCLVFRPACRAGGGLEPADRALRRHGLGHAGLQRGGACSCCGSARSGPGCRRCSSSPY